MAPGDPDRLTFCLEWYDTRSLMTRKFLLFCYSDDTIEIFELKTQKMFLRKIKYPGFNRKDIYIGACLVIYQRQMHVVGYGDGYTLKSRIVLKEHAFALVKPDAFEKMGYIIESIESAGLTISKLKTVNFTLDHALKLYEQHKGQSFLPSLINNITSGPSVVMDLHGDSAIKKWVQLMGPTDSVVARRTAPETLRARFGTDLAKNGVHGAPSRESAERESKICFPSVQNKNTAPRISAKLTPDVTCCIVKPHVIKEPGSLGTIILAIQEQGFHINAMEMFLLDYHNAEEFLEVYRGVLPAYDAMIKELSSGPCVVMEIIGFGRETQKKLRELVGPWDPIIARRLRPYTLRARFAKTSHENALHCTDLPDDGLIECEYFFCLMQ